MFLECLQLVGKGSKQSCFRLIVAIQTAVLFEHVKRVVNGGFSNNHHLYRDCSSVIIIAIVIELCSNKQTDSEAKANIILCSAKTFHFIYMINDQ